VVFESDDWGSIRMPSKKIYNNLLDKGIRVDRSVYDTFDILEQREDLEYLFNLILRVEDLKGNHPIFTFNTVMGNPNFDLIRKSNFTEYHRESFFTSYEKYNQDNMSNQWYKAISENLIHPQFHAREHVNVSLWMRALQSNHNETRIAFDQNFFGLKTEIPSSIQNNFLAAYWAEGSNDLREKLNIVENGLQIFRSIFGFSSTSFTACNYIYPSEMEKAFSDLGIKFIQTQHGHISPAVNNQKKKVIRNFTGQINQADQIYLVRNCTFEPSLYSNLDSVKSCIKEISTAFMWNKPAIISSHRINYVGGLSMKNRDKGLSNLEKLLSEIIKKWPDVEFMSTYELGNLIKRSYENSYSLQKK
jgi:hypothetical protein